MKIVMLLGSPHRNGSSNMLADEFVRGAEEAGHDVEIIDAAHLDIHSCVGCEKCGMDGGCAWNDDNVKIRGALLSADMAVFVTPIYYFGMSAQLKTVIDRFYSYTIRLTAKRLKTALITAAWNGDIDTQECTKNHYLKLCDYMHFQNLGTVLGTSCGNASMTAGSAHLKEAYELGKNIR